jgi:autotransporter-associated beta strand protein
MGAYTVQKAIWISGDGFSAAGALNFTGAGTLTGGLVVQAASKVQVVSGVVANIDSAVSSQATSYALTKIGTGTLVLSQSNTGLISETFVSEGSLRVLSNSALGSASKTTVSSGASVELSGTGLSISEPFTVSGSGVDSSGAIRNLSTVGADTNSLTGLITLAAASEIQSDDGTLTFNVSAGNGFTGAFGLTFDGAGNMTVEDPIATSTGTVTKSGAGTLTLSGTNTYSGLTSVSAGVVVVSSSSSLGATSTGTTITAGAVNISGTNLSIGEPFTVSGTGISSTGAIRNVSTAGADTNSITGAVTLAANTSIGSDDGTLTFDVVSESAFGATTGTPTITFVGAGNVTVADPIATPISTLTKSDAGTLMLSGANTNTIRAQLRSMPGR